MRTKPSLRRARRLSNFWFCPLYMRRIEEGACLDINYERLGFVDVGALQDLKKTTGKSADEVNQECERCPNFPLAGEPQPTESD